MVAFDLVYVKSQYTTHTINTTYHIHILHTADGGKVLVTIGEKGALLLSEEGEEELFPCPNVSHGAVLCLFCCACIC